MGLVISGLVNEVGPRGGETMFKILLSPEYLLVILIPLVMCLAILMGRRALTAIKFRQSLARSGIPGTVPNLNTVLLFTILIVLIWIALQPKPRFQALGEDEDAALDTYTGKVCLTYPLSNENSATGPKDFPYCWMLK